MVLKDKKNILVLIVLNTIIAILVKYKTTVGKKLLISNFAVWTQNILFHLFL